MDKIARAFRALGPIDARAVWRDGLVLTLLVVPPIVTLILRYGVPSLARWLDSEFAFDLAPYFPLILSTLAVLAPGIAGIIVGFLLLDERDERTLTALRVTPLPMDSYLIYRLSVPLAIGFVMTLVTLPLAGLARIAAPNLVGIALVAMLTAPVTALVLGALAPNKVAGLALQKFINGIQNLPILAFFVAPPGQFLFGLFPTYWPMKIVWVASEGGPVWPYAIGGLIANSVFMAVLIRRFRRISDPS